MRLSKTIAFAAVCLSLLALPTVADVYIEQNTKHTGNRGSDRDANVDTRMWISANAIRAENVDGDVIHITDLANNRLITLDKEEKEYFIIPLDRVRSDLERASSRMRRQLSISWEQTRLGQSQEISGYLCRGIRFVGKGGFGDAGKVEITLEFWVSDEANASIDIFIRQMTALGLEANPFVSDMVLDELKRIGGYPIKTITSIKMGAIDDVIEQTVSKIDIVNVASDFYEIPDDFTKAEAPPRD